MVGGLVEALARAMSSADPYGRHAPKRGKGSKSRRRKRRERRAVKAGPPDEQEEPQMIESVENPVVRYRKFPLTIPEDPQALVGTSVWTEHQSTFVKWRLDSALVPRRVLSVRLDNLFRSGVGIEVDMPDGNGICMTLDSSHFYILVPYEPKPPL